MKYTVISYLKAEAAHKCDCHDGTVCYVDLMVNGDFPENTDPLSLIGKTFEADWDFPYVSIAVNVREV